MNLFTLLTSWVTIAWACVANFAFATPLHALESADTLWYEAFAEGMPEDWWQVSTADSVSWQVSDLLSLKNAGSPFEETAVLTTDTISIEAASENIWLEVDMECLFPLGEQRFSLDAWNGMQWESLLTHQETGSGTWRGLVQDLIHPTFRLRFRYESETGAVGEIRIRSISLIATAATCDNGICEAGEDPENCPGDCEVLTGPHPHWVPPGEDLQGRRVTYRTFKGGTDCDDCSEVLDLPFPVIFYGKRYEQVHLNANGNLTFEKPLYEFTPSGFCLQGPRMIAPFFADVDLGRCGSIDYYLDEHALIVTWTEVCHFRGTDNSTGLTNTFQLILTDGSVSHIRDQALSPGTLLLFTYDDMQWTAGNASGGLNGLSGISATVGINAGDGVNCFSYGRFEHAGYDFCTESQGNGVDHLDFRSLQPGEIALTAPQLPPADTIQTLQARVYPNPVSTQLIVSIEQSRTDQPLNLQLIDAGGKALYERNFSAPTDIRQTELPMEKLPTGIYFLILRNGESVMCREIVKR